MSNRALVLVSFACLTAVAASAADDPMIGRWKLNQQKSRLVDEMKVASLGGNKYSFDLGGPNPEIIVVDGTDQPGITGTTLAVSADSPNHWTVVRKKDGHVMVKGIWTLSEDGNSLHDDFTAFGEDGKNTHVDYVYERKGGGAGFAGDWVSTNGQVDTVFVITVQPYQADGLSIASSSGGAATNIKFDGRDYPNPGSLTKTVTSARRVDDRTIEITDKNDGKIADTREMAVSQDSKTLTITIHVPTRDDPNVLVFDKE